MNRFIIPMAEGKALPIIQTPIPVSDEKALPSTCHQHIFTCINSSFVDTPILCISFVGFVLAGLAMHIQFKNHHPSDSSHPDKPDNPRQ